MLCTSYKQNMSTSTKIFITQIGTGSCLSNHHALVITCDWPANRFDKIPSSPDIRRIAIWNIYEMKEKLLKIGASWWLFKQSDRCQRTMTLLKQKKKSQNPKLVLKKTINPVKACTFVKQNIEYNCIYYSCIYVFHSVSAACVVYDSGTLFNICNNYAHVILDTFKPVAIWDATDNHGRPDNGLRRRTHTGILQKLKPGCSWTFYTLTIKTEVLIFGPSDTNTKFTDRPGLSEPKWDKFIKEFGRYIWLWAEIWCSVVKKKILLST